MSNTTKNEQFIITFDCCVNMSVDEIWPDGDAPKNPTVEDVINTIKKSLSFSDWVSSWSLMDDVSLTVIDENDKSITIYGSEV